MIWQKLGDKSSQIITLNNLGLMYDDLGNNEKSLEYYQKSLPLIVSIQPSAISYLSIRPQATKIKSFLVQKLSKRASLLPQCPPEVYCYVTLFLFSDSFIVSNLEL